MTRVLPMAVMLLLQIAVHGNAADLLSDGSFESANLVPNSGGADVNGFTAFGVVNGTLPGSPSWTVATLAGTQNRGAMVASTIANTYFGVNLPADPLTSGLASLAGGTKVIYLIGDDEIVTLSQTVSGLVIGESYNFGFDAAATWTGAFNPANATLKAGIGGVEFSTSSAALPTPTSASSTNSWTHFQGTFTASATSANFLFTYTGLGSPSNNAKDILIDRVFVAPVTVPEPSTLTMALASILAIGGAAYRRARARGDIKN